MAEKVYVIRQLPTGSTPAIRAQREHLQSSRWSVPGVPGGEASAGKPYLVDEATAANLIRKGWVLCDAKGVPTGASAPEVKQDMRAGTEEWYKLPPDQRPGTPEFREAELQRRLHEEWEREHPEPTATPAVAAAANTQGDVTSSQSIGDVTEKTPDVATEDPTKARRFGK